MNKKILKLAGCLAAVIAMAACSSEDVTDSNQLPEGKYPLQISSVTMTAESTAQPWGANAPQSRVKEDDSRDNSVWETNDEIRVGIDGYSDSDSKIYRMTVSNDKKVTVSPSNSPVYWKSKDAKYVMARYPADGTVALDNQTNKLAYALFAKTVGTADYNATNISLPFQHKLAKVRVMLTGDKKDDVTEVKIKTLTSCTLGADGTLTNGSTEDFISMVETTYKSEKCWEANVVPSYKIEKVKVNNVECTLDGGGITPVMAAVNTITITVKKKAVDVSDIIGTDYTVRDNVYLKGNGTEKELNITMEAGSKLTLENVNLRASWGNSAISCKGNSTITLTGENTLSGICAICVENGTLTITGNDGKLTATGTNYYSGGVSGAGIGATNEANIIIEGGNIIATSTVESTGIGSAGAYKTGGDITITGGVIEARGGQYSAGIGGSNSGACGNIYISGGTVRAYGGLQSPGIGNGDGASCGSITISGASTVVYAKKGLENDKSPESIGWNNYNGSCGTVTIGAECSVTQE